MDRLSAGKYVCEATNSIGSGSSDQVQLNVKCTSFLILFLFNMNLFNFYEFDFDMYFFSLVAPFCSTRKLRGIYVGRRETVRVTCNVTSNPTPTHFRLE